MQKLEEKAYLSGGGWTLYLALDQMVCSGLLEDFLGTGWRHAACDNITRGMLIEGPIRQIKKINCNAHNSYQAPNFDRINSRTHQIFQKE